MDDDCDSVMNRNVENRNAKIKEIVVNGVFLFVSIFSFVGGCWWIPNRGFTELDDSVWFEGVVISRGRHGEAILEHEDFRFSIRSNEGTLNDTIRRAKKGDVLSGFMLRDTHNVVELNLNGERIAGIEVYHSYEVWEKNFSLGLGIGGLFGIVYFFWQLVRVATGR